jgi:hypoxanthine phosphoribosyltransferase
VTAMNDCHLHRLLSREEIASVVKHMASRISEDYGDKELVLICVLKGAFIFFSDLIRHLRTPVVIDFIRAASYGAGMKTSGVIKLTKDIEVPLENRDLLIVDDIIDTGRTLKFLKERLWLANPHSVKVCALLDKKARREVAIEADYVGKEIDDVFVVGYGIDFNDRYRNLPEICYVTPIAPPQP